MKTLRRATAALLGAAAFAACKKEEVKVVYQSVPVETRDIVVSAQAAGRIIPDTVVEVKTRASGEVLQIFVETGQKVTRGQRLLTIDPRLPQNQVSLAQASLDVARVQLKTAETQLRRADTLLAAQTITRQEHETAELAFANAKAQFARAQIDLENSRINFEDTDVRAPISGTIIEKSVERGQQIASAVSNVGGGTLLMRMADLSLVQVITLVDETDIGKVKPGLEATVTVDAYPNRPFRGTVLKIEPNDTTVQNVTMFPVRVRIENRDGLLLPGMSAEVDISIGRREGVLAVPNAALRTRRDVASAAGVLGVSMEQVNRQLAAATPAADGESKTSLGAKAPGDSAAPAGAATPAAAKGETMTTPDGRTVTLPAGITEKQARDLFRKRFSGGTLTPEEEQLFLKLRQSFGRNGGARREDGPRQDNSFQFGGDYIVFVNRGGIPTAIPVKTGLTDLDYSEVISGLQAGDSVMILPSASLVQSQQEFRNRFSQMTGGGLGGMRSSQPQGGSAPAGGARPQGQGGGR
jgi:HlyD family secretion protein